MEMALSNLIWITLAPFILGVIITFFFDKGEATLIGLVLTLIMVVAFKVNKVNLPPRATYHEVALISISPPESVLTHFGWSTGGLTSELTYVLRQKVGEFKFLDFKLSGVVFLQETTDNKAKLVTKEICIDSIFFVKVVKLVIFKTPAERHTCKTEYTIVVPEGGIIRNLKI